MKIRLLSLASILSALIMCVTGCGYYTSSDFVMSQSDYEQWTRDKGSPVKENEKVKININDYNQETDITVMLWERDGNGTVKTDDNALTDWIKDEIKRNYNINVSYVTVQRQGANEALEKMIEDGEAPDIVMTYEQEVFYKFAVNGKVRDLNELYKLYGHEIEKYCREAQCGVESIGKRRYAVMKLRGTEFPKHMQYIRKDWLDMLGMKVPTTKEELGDYLRAVKANGLGIPWGMSGRRDTEKMYLNFVGSYVPLEEARTAYIYSGNYIIAAPEAYDGFKQLNQWYNEGLISPDFYEDETEEVYLADVEAGKVGFLLDDPSYAWSRIEKFNVENGLEESYIPCQCFNLPDGKYRDPYENRYGMFIMIPKTTSEEKAVACMKYLNWLAYPYNAMRVLYTPDYEVDEYGIVSAPAKDTLIEKDYPYYSADLCIVNENMEWSNDFEKLAQNLYKTQSSPWATQEWYQSYYTIGFKGKYRYPVYGYVSEPQSESATVLRRELIQFAYSCIKAPNEEFDKVYEEGLSKLKKDGLQKILDDRAEYYDEVN